MNITLVLGTARKERRSEHITDYLQKKFSELSDVNLSYVDVAEWVKSPRTIPEWEDSEESKPWKELMTKTDALVLVVPEYNHSYPGELKLLLDMDFDNYNRMPVVVVGASSGSHGGMRVIEHIQPVLNNFKMNVVPASLRFDSLKDFASMSHDARDDMQKERFDKMLALLREYVQ